MERLTIEHLAPYLPHGLVWAVKTGKGYSRKTTTSIHLDSLLNGTHVTFEGEDYSKDINKTGYKPLLRPLSDLNKYKDIHEKLEEMSVIEWLEETYETHDLHIEAKRLMEDKKWLNHLSHLLFIELTSMRFDIYGLIEKSLAVDVNTLENG